MKKLLFISALIMIVSSCQSQSRQAEPDQVVGGPCEGCEAVLEYGDKYLTSADTLPDFETTTPQLKMTGTVYEADGETPAENVILYIYHTDRNGLYVTRGDEEGWGKRHGYLRGWIKTDDTGLYTFYTFRPGAYPGGSEPEHIHITVKAPGYSEYYIDEFVFDDDPLLTAEERESLAKRGGSGIVQPSIQQNILTVNRDIILGLNIPGY